MNSLLVGVTAILAIGLVNLWLRGGHTRLLRGPSLNFEMLEAHLNRLLLLYEDGSRLILMDRRIPSWMEFIRTPTGVYLDVFALHRHVDQFTIDRFLQQLRGDGYSVNTRASTRGPCLRISLPVGTELSPQALHRLGTMVAATINLDTARARLMFTGVGVSD